MVVVVTARRFRRRGCSGRPSFSGRGLCPDFGGTGVFPLISIGNACELLLDPSNNLATVPIIAGVDLDRPRKIQSSVFLTFAKAQDMHHGTISEKLSRL